MPALIISFTETIEMVISIRVNVVGHVTIAVFTSVFNQFVKVCKLNQLESFYDLHEAKRFC